jgi:uridine kinase
MKVHFLITGLLRTFPDVLYPYLCEVSKDIECEFYICTTAASEDTKFIGKDVSSSVQPFLSNPRCRVCVIDTLNLSNLQHLSQREKNTVYQWYRIQSGFQFIEAAQPSPEDLIVRLRPDIRFGCTPAEFVQLLKTISSTTLTIPSSNDIFNPALLGQIPPCINDQVAIGPISLMRSYCSLYSTIDFSTLHQPILSECILYEHLRANRITPQRVELHYTLCLSEATVLAIAGDSGSGKSTLVEALRTVFPFDKNLVLETDRYHKWERGHESWKTVTHLNPDANFLEKMSDDTYMLKLGEQIQQVDYDHTSGTFTDRTPIESKPYVFLCGLHTLFQQELRTSLDLKVFLHTQPQLKRFWKLQRDMKTRGYTFEKCDAIFQKRQADYERYILPQIEFADICIEYSTYAKLPDIFTIDTPQPPIQLTLTCTSSSTDHLYSFLYRFCREEPHGYFDQTIFPICEESILCLSILLESLPASCKDTIKINELKSGYLGLLQCIFLLLCFKS